MKDNIIVDRLTIESDIRSLWQYIDLIINMFSGDHSLASLILGLKLVSRFLTPFLA